MEYKDYYQILGVSRDASQDDIKRAFRKLARKYHPDTAKDKEGAEQKFKDVNEAYEVLGDPEKRRKYDTLGANWQQAAGAGAGGGYGGRTYTRTGGAGGAGGFEDFFSFGGTGFSDFFDAFFGSMGGARTAEGFTGTGTSPFDMAQERAQRAQRGRDIEGDIMVTLEEVLHGGKRTISFRKDAASPKETYTVTIPKGVKEGQRIRLAGRGGQGSAQGMAGDLYLRVHFERHPYFTPEDSDLYHDLDLSAPKAVLGCTVNVPTLDGKKAQLRIPPGTQNDQKFRLSGFGLPKRNGGRGDLYAVVDIRVPRRPTGRKKELWKELAELEEEKS